MSFDHLIGRRLSDKFEVVSYLARGGMGVVFRGVQHPLGRPVAIKILTVEDDETFRERFFNEASISANISHPNVVRVFDYGVTDDDICFIIMELLQGEPLSSMLKREKTLSPRVSLEVMRDVCSAVQDAHNHGVVHRDLKPSNLFVVERQHRGLFVKVLDFGLAKKLLGGGVDTKTGTFLGSPTYISPEQVRGEPVSTRSDVYNVGLILYRMLTGRDAFRCDQPSATLVAHCTQAPKPFAEVAPDLDAPAGLEWVVMTCLHKDPKRRFGSMDELTKALEICQMVLRGSIAPQRLEITSEGALIVPSGVVLESQMDTGLLQTSGVDLDAPPSSITRPATMLLVGAGSGVVIAVLLVLILVLGGLLFWQVTTRRPDLVQLDPPAPLVEPPAPPAPAPQPTEPPPAPVVQNPDAYQVTVLSEPKRASVFMDNALLGRTPLDVEIPNGEEWTVILSLAGHQNREVILSASQPRVRVPLSPL